MHVSPWHYRLLVLSGTSEEWGQLRDDHTSRMRSSRAAITGNLIVIRVILVCNCTKVQTATAWQQHRIQAEQGNVGSDWQHFSTLTQLHLRSTSCVLGDILSILTHQDHEWAQWQNHGWSKQFCEGRSRHFLAELWQCHPLKHVNHG